MAEKSGFFNALQVDGEYDRTYNANDYSDNLAVVISTGVLRSENDDLKVTSKGLVTTVNAGRAWINGHYYYNDTPLSFAATTVQAGGNRYDRIMLRFDNTIQGRKISLVYVQGTASNSPVAPAPTRTDTIYDLVLADIFITANATGLVITDQRSNADLCGWVYSTSGDDSFFTSLDNDFNSWFQQTKDTLASVTLFKRYTWGTTLTTPSNTVTFSIPQYDPETCFIEVYVNGFYYKQFTSSQSTITFNSTLNAGTTVTVNCYKSIDGTGINSVADEITQLQNKVALLETESTYIYKCTGTNDNWSLSQIAAAFLSGTYSEDDVTPAAKEFIERIGGIDTLNNMPEYAQLTIKVVGVCGATTPVYGQGTTTSRYRWFSFGTINSTDRKLVVDFAECQSISIAATTANTNHIVFYGTDLNIKNANVSAHGMGAACAIDMVAGSSNTGIINVDDCKFEIKTTGTARIGENGNFTNCRAKLYSTGSHALCFVPKDTSFIRVIGGTYYAYKVGSSIAAIFYTYSTDTNAVAMATNISAPTVSESGYSQQYLAVGYGGKIYINTVCSTQTTTGNYVEVVGQIWKTKR